MGRREVYCIDERLQLYFIRWELEDRPVRVEGLRRTTPYRHEEVPTWCVRWSGLHLTKYGDQPEQRAMGSLVSDAGPKAGISVVTERAPEAPCSPEERAAGRERVRRAVERIFGCRCGWRDEREHQGSAGLSCTETYTFDPSPARDETMTKEGENCLNSMRTKIN